MLDTDGLLYIGIFLFFALLCIGIGIFFIYQMGKSKSVLLTENKHNTQDNSSDVAATVVEKILAKKGLLIDQWRKTNRLRDQMKILKIATNAKKSSRASQ